MSAAQRTLQRITFTVPGKPIPAKRMTFAGVRNPRHTKRRQMDNYLAYKLSVGWHAKQAGAVPLSGRLYVRLWVYTSRTGRSRGDADNFAKAALDGMNGVVMGDDSQVDDLRVQMRRVPAGSESMDVEVGVMAND